MNAFIDVLNSSGSQFLGFAGPMLLQSSIVIAVLFALDWLLRDRVRAVVRHAVWMLALLKMLLPPSLALPTSPAYWMRRQTAPPALPPIVFTREYTPPLVMDFQLPAAVMDIAPVIPPAPRLTRSGAATLVVVLVAAALLAVLVQRARLVRRIIRHATPPSDSLQTLLASCAVQMRIRCRIGIRLSDAVPGPALCGLLRPVILIPARVADKLSTAQLRAVLLHELAHFQRGDLWINHLQTLLQIVYWWHPLLWLANARIRRVREEAVDETVLAAMGSESDAYPDALLQIGKFSLAPGRGFIGLVGIVESRSALVRRIERLLRLTFEPRPRVGAAGFAAVLLCAVVLLPMASAQVREPQIVPAAKPTPFVKPPQVQLEVKWIDIKTPTNQPSPLTRAIPKWSLTGRPKPDPAGMRSGDIRVRPSTNAVQDVPNSVAAADVMPEADAKDFFENLKATKGADLLAAPRVSTLHERAAEIDLTENKNVVIKVSQEFSQETQDGGLKTVYHTEDFSVGPRVKLVPSVSKDLKLISLDVDGTLTEFIGYRGPVRPNPEFVVPHPTFRQRRLAFTADLKSGESLILAATDVLAGVTGPDGKPGIGMDQRSTLMLLVTSKLIDERGLPLNDNGSENPRSSPPQPGGAAVSPRADAVVHGVTLGAAATGSKIAPALTSSPGLDSPPIESEMGQRPHWRLHFGNLEVQLSPDAYDLVAGVKAAMQNERVETHHRWIQLLKLAEAPPPQGSTVESLGRSDLVRVSISSRIQHASVTPENLKLHWSGIINALSRDWELKEETTEELLKVTMKLTDGTVSDAAVDPAHKTTRTLNSPSPGPGLAEEKTGTKESDDSVGLKTITFRVNLRAFLKNIEFVLSQPPFNGKESDRLSYYRELLRPKPNGQQPVPPGRSAAPDQRTGIEIDMAKPVELVRRYFSLVGIDFAYGEELEGRKALFFNERTGMVFVRATKDEMEIVEKALQVVNSTPHLITLDAHSAELTEAEANTLGLSWPLSAVGEYPPPTPGPVSAGESNPGQPSAKPQPLDTARSQPPGNIPVVRKLTEPQTQVMLKALESDKLLKTGPRVTTVEGRTADLQLSVAESAFDTAPGVAKLPIGSQENVVPFGSGAAVTPFVEVDDRTIQLIVMVSVVEFLGYADPGPFDETKKDRARDLNGKLPLPKFRVRERLCSATLADGHTLVLNWGQARLAPPGAPQTKLFIFITPTMIDPAGNRLYPAEAEAR